MEAIREAGLSMPLVLRDDAAGVATLTLNRPDKLNAITSEMMSELGAHLEDIAVDPAVGCVSLTGAGRCFGAGHDLAETGQSERGRGGHSDAEIVDRLEQLAQPTIAAVHGYCLTGSLELALACDLIMATESAQFADNHGQWGLVPIWGMSVRLPERVGRSRALDLAFTGRRVSGAEALAIGLADRCVPEGQLAAAVADLGAQITVGSRDANAMVKRLYRDQSAMTRPEALAFERTRPYGLPADGRTRRSGRG
ncbi:MAG TPA: enoyl-CoA hydratase/isomerase family protein [Streptosporangiaceae bacterium]|nr:enoyl-CoA hydratase/isomerase family protein [Streptosporangiaceae bacterium]